MKKSSQKKKSKQRPIHHHPAVLVSIVLAIIALLFVTKTILAQQIIIIPNPPDTDYTTHKNLQLRTFGYITLPPAPTIIAPTNPPSYCTGNDCCQDDQLKPTPQPGQSACSCPSIDEEGHSCKIYDRTKYAPYGCPTTEWFPWVFNSQAVCIIRDANTWNTWRAQNPTAQCDDVCFAKPVIYLYPTKPTDISVKLTIPGIVTVSDPTYPTTSGWQHVLAQPNGDLIYQGKHYTELFYEDSVTKHEVPPTGEIISTNKLKQRLTEITTQLGLKPSEQQEFLNYWLPKLYQLHSKYILFSILTPEQKEAVDHVDISPKPDTMIAFLAYFKPLQQPVAIAPLVLSQTPPQRIGFTAVEWGGTIDR